MIYISENDLWMALTSKIGQRPMTEIWNRLVELGYVDEVLDDTADLDYLEEMYRQFERYREVTQLPKDIVDSDTRRVRLEILSNLVADQAADDLDVAAFRQQHLAKGLLKAEEIESWISKQYTRDGPNTIYMKVPIPDGYELVRRDGCICTEPPLTVSSATPATHIEVELLALALPGEEYVRRLAVKRGGVLDKLRVVSKALARRYTWQEAQASAFVLTSIVPLLASLRGSIRMMFSLPISSRITMEIDPTLTPEEVAEHYKRIRSSLIGARYRSMSEKHLRLAEFYRGEKPEGTTWSDLMTKWNASQKAAWRYTRFEIFARDCKQAWDRLIGRGLLKYS